MTWLLYHYFFYCFFSQSQILSGNVQARSFSWAAPLSTVTQRKCPANNLTVKYFVSFLVRSNPNKLNEAILVFGDCHGQVNALLFSAATMALFDRPSQPAGSKQGEKIFSLMTKHQYPSLEKTMK